MVRFSESWVGLKNHIKLIERALKHEKLIEPLLSRPPSNDEVLSCLAHGRCTI